MNYIYFANNEQEIEFPRIKFGGDFKYKKEGLSIIVEVPEKGRDRFIRRNGDRLKNMGFKLL